MCCGASFAPEGIFRAIRLPFSSLRYRLITTVVVIEAIMLLILVWNYTIEIRQTHEERLRGTAAVVTDQFVATAGRYLVEVDYPSLYEYSRRVLEHAEVSYITIQDERGEPILRLTDPTYSAPDPSKSDPGMVMDVGRNIPLGGRIRGRVHLGFSYALTNRAIDESRRQGIIIAAIEIILSVLVALLVGFALTRDLRVLAAAATRFGGGDASVAVPVRSRDEVGQVAVAFNAMVAERAQSEELLRQSEARLRHFADSTPIPLGVARLSDWTILYCNPLVAPAFALPSDAGPGRSLMDFVAEPSDRPMLVSALQNEGELREFEVVFRRADGELADMLVSASKMLVDGEEVLVFGLYDVTERKKTQAQLVQAQKMEVVGQLTGGIAHDFNNLLMVVQGSLELIARQDSSDARAKHVGLALRAVSRGSELTHRLLAFSRRQALHPKLIDLNDLIRDIAGLLDRSLGETVRVETLFYPGLWPVFIDPGQMENSLLNLALNARDAMPSGGTLTIESSNRAVGEEDTTEAGVPVGDYIEITVSDTGSGMTPEVVAQIFEPFFTTKDIGSGSGLGLSMAYGFAQQSGGDLKVRSEPDKGSAFCFLFPRAGREAESAANRRVVGAENTATLAIAPKGKGETVLLVEDDPEVRRMASTLTGELGYKVLVAEDGLSALEMLAKQPEVDVLLSDVILPGGMIGPDLAERAVELKPDLKVLFMSGYSEDNFSGTNARARRFLLLNKPFSRAELAQKLRQTLDKS